MTPVYSYLMAKTQCQSTIALPVLFLFNGKKGSRKKNKWEQGLKETKQDKVTQI